jgi:Superinfection immunity protein
MVELLLAADDDTGAGVGAGLIVLFVISFVFYWVPTVVALVRAVPNRASVIVINLFLGWTLIGWVVALSMAVRTKP